MKNFVRILVSLLLLVAASSAHTALTASRLRCEYLTDPLGIDETAPRLSWIVESPARGERQTAYQVLVASTPELLAGNQGDLWDSGKVASDATAQIVYGGTPLTSRAACHWKVRTWNQSGVVSGWSAPASWTVGLLQPSDWSAQWIDGMVFGPAAQTAAPPIIAAYYEGIRSGSGSLNVTTQVAALIASGNRLVLVNTGTFGSDPAPNIPKQLRVQYQRGGPTLTKTFPERSLAILPTDLTPAPTNLIITSARYMSTTSSAFRDVTTTLNNVAAGGPFSVIVNNNTFAPDPAPNQPKQLLVVYTVNGATGSVVIPENNSLNYPADLVLPVPAVITAATYEAVDGNGSADVKANLAARVQNGIYSVTVNNTSLNGGSDPAFNHMKRLRVAYTVNGIASVKYVPENGTFTFPADLRFPENVAYLRKSLTLPKPVRRATLYATALGTYEFQINGNRVGDQWFAPGWTENSKRLRYQAYDVSSQLVQGQNVLGAQLSGTWYSGNTGNGGFQVGGLSRALLAQLEVTYDDSTTERFVSDSSWKMQASGTLNSDLMNGEDFDATREIAGWSLSGYDDSGWASVLLRSEGARTMNSQAAEPVRQLGEVKSIALTQPRTGKWTFDFGQNMTGVVRLKVSAPAGTVLSIQHSEFLNPDGSIYTTNLRGASARDSYVCKGGGVEVWQPRFTFHGFRYVEIAGLPSEPALDAVTGIFLGSDTPIVGQLTTSDRLLNRLQSNILWGQRDNYLSVPTDCPQRNERMGWMGDAQVFIRTATYNADVAAFFTKWMADVNDSQTATGAFSDIAPFNNAGAGSPAWGDAGVICPWMIYKAYGDTRLLAKCYPNIVRWVQWCQSNSSNGLRTGNRGSDFGDWLAINADTSKELIGTAFYAHSVDLAARIATVLGKTDDAATYNALFQQIKAAFNNAYINPTTGVCKSPTQCSYALALEFDLVPDALRLKMAQLMEDDIVAKGNHLSTGFVGVGHLLPSLTNNGKLADAYTLIQQDTFPSWLFSVKLGATTIWERWDGWTPDKGFQDAGMNSFNHYSLGACGEWLYSTVAGIDQDPSAVGYRKIVIHPQPGGALTSASASLDSISGKIASNWSSGDGGFVLNATIPANTTATVYVPATDASLVRESDVPAANAPGVAFLRMEGGSAIYSVQSGRYSFAVQGRLVPGTDNINRDSLGRAQVSVSSLLANDGAGAAFLSVDPVSVHGASVSVVNGNIVYRPQADYTGSDSFTYTVRSAQGGVITQTVYVAAMTGPDTALKPLGVSSMPGGSTHVSFTGVPYRSYRVQFTSFLNNQTTWNEYGTVQAAADGSFSINDPLTSPVRFYRAVFP